MSCALPATNMRLLGATTFAVGTDDCVGGVRTLREAFDDGGSASDGLVGADVDVRLVEARAIVVSFWLAMEI